MTFDGLFTKWMTKEISDQIIGGRISKIHQPLPYEIQLTIRANRKNHILLCSAHPMMARVHFMTEKADNPETAPNFCMILRKHLEGAIISDFKQLGSDRILQMDIDSRNELGDEAKWRFTIELMGRHSNMFLINRQENIIVDCLKRVPLSQNSFRTLQPGAVYQLPPHQVKKNPFDYDLFQLDVLLQMKPSQEQASKLLMDQFQGVSSQTAHEIVERALRKDQSLAEALYGYIQEGNQALRPTLSIRNQKSYFTPFPYLSLNADQEKYFDSLSALLEAYYINRSQEERIQQLAGNLLQMLKSELKKNCDKLVKLDDDLAKSEQAESYRIKGDLLNTYQHMIEKGQDQITLDNYYDDNQPMTIALSHRLNPSQNAQSYFKRYQKLRNSIQHIEEQKRETLEEIDYIETILVQIEDSDVKNLEAIREELTQSGYLKKQARKGKQKTASSKPYEFFASDGTRILVGRNNIQNDQLSLRTAKKDYLWLHAQNIPGAHVIVESNNPSDETIGQAANLAAYYSKFRHSATVPVDYLPVKFLRKPNGAKPGFVVYEGQQNTFITPNEELVRQMSKPVQR